MGDWKLTEEKAPEGFEWEYKYKPGEVTHIGWGITRVNNYIGPDGGRQKDAYLHPNLIDEENAHYVRRRLVGKCEDVITEEESLVLRKRSIDAEIARLEKLKKSIR